MKRIELDRWSVMQDVLLQGLPMHIFEDGTDFGEYTHLMSDFIEIDHLGYLQKIFSSTPYFGRELRLFNAYPWWYRCRFEADEVLCSNRLLRLCFTSADYRASVYLNGQHIGTHEGYSSSFSFDVTSAIHVGMNALYVMVEAPWDQEISPGSQAMRCFSVRRRMVKGTYEHGDGFIQRDVNPIGLVGPVFIEAYDSAALSDWRIDADGSGFLRLRFHADGISDISYATGTVTDKEGRIAGTFSAAVKAENDIAIHIPDPHLWSVWDHGEPYLYGLHVEVQEGGNASVQYDFRVGFRDAGMIRTSARTEFILNGTRIFLRGTSYFPDVYTQDIPRERYLRDLRRMKEAGFNAIRVHVHVEQDMFYDLCDEMGFIVFQDSDFSWNHPSDPEWLASAFPVFDAMVMKLCRHPSVSCWILLNEPDKWKTLVEAFGKSLDEIAASADSITTGIGKELVRRIRYLDPSRPYIRASYAEDDPESGDSHNYLGSLRGQETQYTDIDGSSEKLNTEFGMDAPGSLSNLLGIPELVHLLKPIENEVPRIQEYQYKLLKYYIEHYRKQKYRPCSGYFQFMFIDLCPQSFYGVYDWWGDPKPSLRAIHESNGPIAIMGQPKGNKTEVIVVNDTPDPFEAIVEWRISDGGIESTGSYQCHCLSDSLMRTALIPAAKGCGLDLILRNADGTIIARNHYDNAFVEMRHIKGHPLRMDNEYGMRTFR